MRSAKQTDLYLPTEDVLAPVLTLVFAGVLLVVAALHLDASKQASMAAKIEQHPSRLTGNFWQKELSGIIGTRPSATRPL